MKSNLYEYKLNKSALKPGKPANVLNNLENLYTGNNPVFDAKRGLQFLLNLSNGEKRHDSQHSFEYIHDGIENMFQIMESNQAITSSPTEETERKNFYVKLAKGYKVLGDLILKEFSENAIGQSDLYSLMETIGDGGYACAGRWREVLEKLLNGFSHKFTQQNTPDQALDKLNSEISELFSSAREIVGNRSAERFFNLYFGNISEGSKLHYINFFKRFLNNKKDYHLPVTMEEDSYLRSSMGDLTKAADEYLSHHNLDREVIRLTLSGLLEKIRQDYSIYEAILNYQEGIFHKHGLGDKYEDMGQFLSEQIFDGYSREMRKEAAVDLLLEKGFIKKNLNKSKFIETLLNFINSHEPVSFENLLDKVSSDAYRSMSMRDLLFIDGKTDENPLLLAAQKNKAPFLEALLKSGAPVDQKDKRGLDALYLATEKGYEEIVRILLTHGASKNKQYKFGETVLHIAADCGYSSIAKLLIDAGSELDIKDKTGNTPLHLASENGHVEIVKLLLEKGAKVNPKNLSGFSPLFKASLNYHASTVTALIENGANIDLQDNNGTTVLHWAASLGDLEMTKIILAGGAALDLPDKFGNTPLHQAIKDCRQKIALELIENNANLYQKNEYGQSPLHLATSNGLIEVLVELLKRGASPDLQDNQLFTPLHLAVKKGSPSIIKLLLENNANLNLACENGLTPLQLALERGNLEIIRLLKGTHKDLEEKCSSAYLALNR